LPTPPRPPSSRRVGHEQPTAATYGSRVHQRTGRRHVHAQPHYRYPPRRATRRCRCRSTSDSCRRSWPPPTSPAPSTPPSPANAATRTWPPPFELHPLATDEVSAVGRPYRVIRWGVFVADPDYAETFAGELVSYGAVHIRRDGSLRYNPRGLREPLTADELAQLLTQIQDSRGG
jgi:hypothetical protein